MLQCRDHAISPTPSSAWQTQLPTQRDPTTKQFILGKATDPSAGKAEEEPANTDEWGNQIEARQPAQTDNTGSATELAVKGDTRYLVQKMEGGTTCDLTRKPRRVEVQYHCNPHVTDRIGYIKEVITCSYLMVVYTPRLCNDIAFQPPKENKAHEIVCRVIVSEEELSYLSELQMLEDELAAADESVEEKLPIIVGGVVLGGGKFHSSEGQRMPIPPNLGKDSATGGKSIEIIARGKSKAEEAK